MVKTRIDKYAEIVHEEGETLPADFKVKPGEFHTFIRGGKPRRVEFLCPCGCGSECPTRVVAAGEPHDERQWEYKTGGHLIHPSVWWQSGCLSHFFINIDGTVQWC